MSSKSAHDFKKIRKITHLSEPRYASGKDLQWKPFTKEQAEKLPKEIPLKIKDRCWNCKKQMPIIKMLLPIQTKEVINLEDITTDEWDYEECCAKCKFPIGGVTLIE